MVEKRTGTLRSRAGRSADRERLAQYHALFRSANERLLVGARGLAWDVRLVPLVCECGDGDCLGTVEIAPEEFEAVRGTADRFVVLDGHEFEGVEHVVERSERFVVVEKVHGERG